MADSPNHLVASDGDDDDDGGGDHDDQVPIYTQKTLSFKISD
jgi:hypothetical protein